MSKFLLERDYKFASEEILNANKKGSEGISLTLSRGDSIIFPYSFKISTDFESSYYYVKKIILTLIWMVGGDSIYYNGNHDFFIYLKDKLYKDEEVLNSFKEMETIFSIPFEVKENITPLAKKEHLTRFGTSFDGYRIGLDLGGSDRKVTSSKNGEVLFSEEVIWDPKNQKDYKYHEEGILDSLLRAKSYLPRVDAIGISTAGVVLDNYYKSPALFKDVPSIDIKEHVAPIFFNIINKHFQGVPFAVANDGDVSAIGASLLFKKDNVLGLALGTSFAAGYASKGCLNNFINELSKVPVNFDINARSHYIFNIKGAASDYLSQKGIVLLLEKNGKKYKGKTLPEKLLEIQEDAKRGDKLTLDAYHDMGLYLGDAIYYFSFFAPISSVLLLGRVLTGIGGEIIKDVASSYLKEKKANIEVFTPDENFKRLGQSYIASCLPVID